MAFKDLLDGHNLIGGVFRNMTEVKQDKLRGNANKASVMTHTYDDSLSLAKVDIVAPPVDLRNFTLIIITLTTEVWMYTGNSCPLYTDFLEWMEELMDGMSTKKRCEFISTYLRRTLWEIMVEVDKF